jgi:hypothetical protein
MFFPSEETLNLLFYDDKDCDLKQVYELYKRGDHDGAIRMMDSSLGQCKSGHKKDKTLARAYYDAGLLQCLQRDYEKASGLFTSAMADKGAEAAAMASSACRRAQDGADQVKDHEARLAQIAAPSPIVTTPEKSASPKPSATKLKPSDNGEDAGASGDVSAASPGTVTVEERLRKLNNLYKRGLINKKEYEEKRAAILKDL